MRASGLGCFCVFVYCFHEVRKKSFKGLGSRETGLGPGCCGFSAWGLLVKVSGFQESMGQASTAFWVEGLVCFVGAFGVCRVRWWLLLGMMV